MKRKFMPYMLSALMLLALTACGGNNSAQPEPNAKMVSKTIAGVEYEVPEFWEESSSTEDIHYFYPDDGMLMVGYSKMDQSTTDDSAREEFIKSFSDGMESCELLSEEKIKVAGTDGYRHEMNIGMSNKIWKTSMVTFDETDGIISFMMATLSDSDENYDTDFEHILNSIKTINPVSTGESNNATESAEMVKEKLDIKAVPTLDGLMCLFITNNSQTIIDELDVQINYKDDSGATIDTDSDGHDMFLPNSTVVSRLDAPDNYSEYDIETNLELGVNPNYINHSNDIMVNSNQGDSCIIIEITNNSDITIDEIEYIAVLYKGNEIVTVEYPVDIMDVPSGNTITEKVETFDTDYDRFEIYLNQAHTFGL